MSEDRREYTRVETRFRAYLRKLDNKSTLSSFHGYLNEAPGPNIEELRRANLPDPVIEFLIGLDTKMDMLIGMTTQDKLRNEFPYCVEVSEISGAGLRFESSDDFEVGGSYEIVMELQSLPVRMAGAIGTIARPQSEQEGKDWAFVFSRIRDADLEAIVQFVFQEQRSRIREEKWGR